jgi:hypothetical protein
MTSKSDKTPAQVTCVIEVSPQVVDAGAEMTLHGRVSCAPACDLRGHTLLIKDETGADRGSLELTDFDGATNETGELAVKAPVKPGGYTWLAVYEEKSTPFSFTIQPHTTNIVVWDVPSAVEAGERFRIKVGIKCSGECPFTNREFEIYDDNGKRVATGTLSGDRWPGTALYSAEVELEAPAAEGLYTWSVACAGTDAGLPHAESSVSFGVRAVGHPEYEVTVETIDKESQTPLSGARVVMHPYRAVTDERGVAKVRVAKGLYKLFVTQTNYLTFGLPVEVTSDMTARAELELEPVQERN